MSLIRAAENATVTFEGTTKISTTIVILKEPNLVERLDLV